MKYAAYLSGVKLNFFIKFFTHTSNLQLPISLQLQGAEREAVVNYRERSATQ